MLIVKGQKQINKNIEKFLKNLIKTSGDGVFEAAESIRQSALPITPKDTGDLISSSFTVSDTMSAGNPSKKSAMAGLKSMAERGTSKAVAGYDTSYAVPVHENLESKHKAPTTAKFLEKPFKENSPEVINQIAEKMKFGN